MKYNSQNYLAAILLFIVCAASSTMSAVAAPASEDSIFNTEKILDESTLETKTLQDWHTDKATGSTRQKLIEIKVAEWLRGKITGSRCG